MSVFSVGSKTGQSPKQVFCSLNTFNSDACFPFLTELKEEYGPGRSADRTGPEENQSRFLLVFPIPGLKVLVGSSW